MDSKELKNLQAPIK